MGVAVTGLPVAELKLAAGLHTYVPAPPAARFVPAPAHSVTLPEAVTVGRSFTVTVTDAVFVHPFASVPVTVYVVLTVGVAVTGVPVVALNPVEGVHAYVPAPLALKFVDAPMQKLTLPEVVTFGNGFTVTAKLAVLVHPFTSVPVTV